MLFWPLLTAPEGDFQGPVDLNKPISFFHLFRLPVPFLWKYPVTVYALHAIYAVQPMKNT